MLSTKQGWPSAVAGPTPDPFFANVTFLLKTFSGGSTNNRTYIDSSSNALTITPPTNPTWSYDNPFNSSGYYGSIFNNSSIQTVRGMTFPNNALMNPGGDCTLECWAKAPLAAINWFHTTYSILLNSSQSQNNIISSNNGTTFWNTQGYSAPSYARQTTTVTARDSVWRHIALVRNGTGSGNLKLYIDGVASGTASSISTSSLNYIIGCFMAGSNGGSDNPFSGWGTYLRFSNIARYTANFTKPTAPWANDANTLLYNQFANAAFLDVSNNKTPFSQAPTSGTVAIVQSSSNQKFSGLNSIQISGIATVGLSGSSFLYPASGTGTVTISGNFTWECWVYVSSATTQNATSAVFFTAIGPFNFYTNIAASPNVFSVTIQGGTNVSSGVNAKDNAWHFLTAQRSGTTGNNFCAWVDGVPFAFVAMGTTSYSFVTGSQPFIGGTSTASQNLIGNISDVRFTNGVARYTNGASFTPPTTQFPSS